MREGWKDTKGLHDCERCNKSEEREIRVIENNIGYVKLSQFQERTADDLEAALSKLGSRI